MIGYNMKTMRLNKNLSILDLHMMTNVSTSVISNIETGKIKNPRVKTIYKLLIALNEEDKSIKDLVS